MSEDMEKSAAALVWGADGAPRSAAFDDVYFDADDGLAETRHVFHDAIALSSLWRGRDRFVVAELGFGLGLSFCATALAWSREEIPPAATLEFVSFELAPPSADEIRRAVARWPEIADVADALLDAGDWPPGPGWSRRVVAQGPRRVVLDLAVGDARALTPAWSGAANAWFLDGFNPAKNPALWDATLLGAVAARTASDGVFATYTAAGWVRRNLTAAGFEVEKVPGYGRKRDMSRGRLVGSRVSTLSPPAGPATTDDTNR